MVTLKENQMQGSLAIINPSGTIKALKTLELVPKIHTEIVEEM